MTIKNIRENYEAAIAVILFLVSCGVGILSLCYFILTNLHRREIHVFLACAVIAGLCFLLAEWGRKRAFRRLNEKARRRAAREYVDALVKNNPEFAEVRPEVRKHLEQKYYELRVENSRRSNAYIEWYDRDRDDRPTPKEFERITLKEFGLPEVKGKPYYQ